MVLEDNSLVLTPPKVTSAVLYPSEPVGFIIQVLIASLNCFKILLDIQKYFHLLYFHYK